MSMLLLGDWEQLLDGSGQQLVRMLQTVSLPLIIRQAACLAVSPVAAWALEAGGLLWREAIRRSLPSSMRPEAASSRGWPAGVARGATASLSLLYFGQSDGFAAGGRSVCIANFQRFRNGSVGPHATPQRRAKQIARKDAEKGVNAAKCRPDYRTCTLYTGVTSWVAVRAKSQSMPPLLTSNNVTSGEALSRRLAPSRREAGGIDVR